MTEIHTLSALELTSAIRARDISCREAMLASLAQIARHNLEYNAIINLKDPEALLREADAHDATVASGADLPPLHGLPHALKDLTDTKDMVCARGSPLLQGFIPAADSIMVERLRRAGAIFIGKTNVPEFGLGSHTFNPLHGMTRNAYDLKKSAGGSSGGAAVALALRMVPLADGSDMMGSLRNPAGWNNVNGFRPSFGRVPSGGIGDVFMHQLSTEGPMARNMTDLALLLDVQAGRDDRAPLSLANPSPPFAPLQMRNMRGKRIGWLGDLDGYLPMQAGVMELCTSALATFTAIGCDVAIAKPRFDMKRVWRAWTSLRSFQIAASLGGYYDDAAARAFLKPEAIYEIEAGRALSGSAVALASLERSAWYQEMRRLLQEFDCLVLPTAAMFAFDAQLRWPQQIGATLMDTYHRWMEVVVPAALIGLPTLAVPAGFSAADEPMGLQIIGPAGADHAVLELGLAYEAACGHGTRLPPAL